jgi:hypothetical protein
MQAFTYLHIYRCVLWRCESITVEISFWRLFFLFFFCFWPRPIRRLHGAKWDQRAKFDRA